MLGAFMGKERWSLASQSPGVESGLVNNDHRPSRAQSGADILVWIEWPWMEHGRDDVLATFVAGWKACITLESGADILVCIEWLWMDLGPA